MNLKVCSAILASVLAGLSLAQSGKTSLAIDVGGYYPTNSKIRSIYDTGIKFGISPSERLANHWVLGADIGAIIDSHNGNKLFILPANIAYERSFGEDADNVRPYIKFSGGVVYNDHSFDDGSMHVSNKTIGGDGAIEGGIYFAKHWRLMGRYNWFQKSDDYEFSGWTYSIQYTFGRF